MLCEEGVLELRGDPRASGAVLRAVTSIRPGFLGVCVLVLGVLQRILLRVVGFGYEGERILEYVSVLRVVRPERVRVFLVEKVLEVAVPLAFGDRRGLRHPVEVVEDGGPGKNRLRDSRGAVEGREVRVDF